MRALELRAGAAPDSAADATLGRARTLVRQRDVFSSKYPFGPRTTSPSYRHRSPRAPRGASKGVAMADKDTKKKATVLDMSKRAPMLEKSPIPLGLGLR